MWFKWNLEKVRLQGSRGVPTNCGTDTPGTQVTVAGGSRTGELQKVFEVERL